MLTEVAKADSGAQASADALFAPVGLDIGAETAEQIALSIVAEAQAVLSGASAGFLRERKGGIHETERRSDVMAAE